jgi:hypothetical protein
MSASNNQVTFPAFNNLPEKKIRLTKVQLNSLSSLLKKLYPEMFYFDGFEKTLLNFINYYISKANYCDWILAEDMTRDDIVVYLKAYLKLEVQKSKIESKNKLSKSSINNSISNIAAKAVFDITQGAIKQVAENEKKEQQESEARAKAKVINDQAIKELDDKFNQKWIEVVNQIMKELRAKPTGYIIDFTKVFESKFATNLLCDKLLDWFNNEFLPKLPLRNTTDAIFFLVNEDKAKAGPLKGDMIDLVRDLFKTKKFCFGEE